MYIFQVEIQQARSIEQIFDAISYNKGSALIRMVQGFLGDELFQVWNLMSLHVFGGHAVFSYIRSYDLLFIWAASFFKQKSLSLYIQRYAGKNAKTEDLWRVLSAESGVRVEPLMNAWTKTKGYPVISVKAKGHTLEFEQV